jgi:CRISPR type III-A-associated protein Csm2
MAFKQEWITKELDPDGINYLNAFAETDGKLISITKLRRFYGELKRIEALGVNKELLAFRMLQPKLAYTVGREEIKTRGPIEKLAKEILFPSILKVGEPSLTDEVRNSRFKNFVSVFETIVAFHKYHGGAK